MEKGHPCVNEPNWEHQANQEWTRPLLGAESTLDQVDQLCDGQYQLVFGFAITTLITPADFISRLTSALIRLRFASPLVASTLQAGRHDPQLRSWVYRPCSSHQEAREWAKSTLHIVTAEDPQRYATELPLHLLRETQPAQLRDQPFSCHLLVNGAGTPHAVLFHMSHALTDGAGSLATFKLFFGWIMKDPDPDVENLEWGEEVKNLPTGPVTSSGGPKEGWSTDGVRMLEQFGQGLSQQQPPHSLKPSRLAVTIPGRTVRASDVIPPMVAATLIRDVKNLGFTVTQLFDAAFALATFRYNPSDNEEEGHVTFFPALVNLRPHIRPLYDGHDPDTFMCVYSAGVPICVPFSTHITPHKEPRAQMLSLMTSIKSQYKSFISNPHLVHIAAAQTAISPLRQMRAPPNPFWGEITGFGVIESRTPVDWYHPSTPQGGDADVGDEERIVALEVKDALLGLRMRHFRPITHVWSLRGELRLQIQASDVWDEDYLAGFLNEIILCAKLCLAT